jgi:hypothetical protein
VFAGERTCLTCFNRGESTSDTCVAVNAIVCWNTAYLEHLVATRGRIDPTLLAHISPAMLEHVNPYGTYEVPIATEDARTDYRSLRDPQV